MEKEVNRIYLDYNATTPLDSEVITTITAVLQNAWGNPSSLYKAGMNAKDAISIARGEVADAINSEPTDIIFTSGGTESNNWVIQTAVENFRRTHHSSHKKPHVISSSVEHDSVSIPLLAMAKKGELDVTFVPINEKQGVITPEDVVGFLKPETCLVTIMMANNETGTIMPIKDICSEVKKNCSTARPLLHTDAAQCLGKILIDVQDLGVNYLTIVGHKFYGPRIGALFVRGLDRGITPLYPLFYGGGQERNFRPGTENTPMIAGLGKAALISNKRLKEISSHMSAMRNYLEKKLMDECAEGMIKFNCASRPRLPNTCSVSFTGADMKGYNILKAIKGFSCSAGSACHSDTCQPSKVLLNFHISLEQASNTIRISTGRSTSRDDIDAVVKELKSITSLMQSKQ